MKISDKALEDFKKSLVDDGGLQVFIILKKYHNWMFNEMVECYLCMKGDYYRPTPTCPNCQGKGKVPRYKTYEEE